MCFWGARPLRGGVPAVVRAKGSPPKHFQPPGSSFVWLVGTQRGGLPTKSIGTG